MLDNLALKYGSDKGKWRPNGKLGVGYCEHYERLFRPIRGRSLKILELGVLNGASLRMWKEYFPNANIYGIDINPECLQHEEDRIKIFIGDQLDREFLKGVSNQVGFFDIIIDDAAHTTESHISSFNTLFRKVVGGGLYIIEDVRAAVLLSEVKGGKRTTLDIFSRRAKDMILQEENTTIRGIEFIRTNKRGALIAVRK